MASSSTLTGTELSASEATDPSLCRISGYIMDAHGNALKGYAITVRHVYAPIAVGASTLVLNERQVVRTDSDGLLQFDAYQSSKLKIELPGRLLDLARVVNVPAASSADIIGLVFPYVASIAHDDSSDEPLDKSVGDSFSLDLTGTLSDGEEVDVSAYVTLESDDEDVVSVSGTTLTAEGSGTATITVTDLDTDSMDIYKEADGDVIERLDHPDITFPEIEVSVS